MRAFAILHVIVYSTKGEENPLNIKLGISFAGDTFGYEAVNGD